MITSTANPKVKEVLRLRKRRERDATGRFVIEGRRELSRAFAAGVEIVEVFVCPSLAAPGGFALLDDARGAGAEGHETNDVVFRRLSYREAPDGVLGVARLFSTDLDRLDLPDQPLVLVAAQIEKPGNLGTMVRSAAAAGADALIVADGVTDLFNPNVVRASQGALFGLPVAVADAGTAIAWLRAREIAIHVAVPEGTTPFWDLPLAAPAALVIGSEHLGVPAAWRDAADTSATIPMPGSDGVDSLNAASCASILLFEAVRQRASAG